VEWVVREGVGAGGEMNQALYAHMNNKRKKINPSTAKKKKKKKT
jgi:NaMN:DMB phosphoribosyltransferase